MLRPGAPPTRKQKTPERQPGTALKDGVSLRFPSGHERQSLWTLHALPLASNPGTPTGVVVRCDSRKGTSMEILASLIPLHCERLTVAGAPGADAVAEYGAWRRGT